MLTLTHHMDPPQTFLLPGSLIHYLDDHPPGNNSGYIFLQLLLIPAPAVAPPSLPRNNPPQLTHLQLLESKPFAPWPSPTLPTPPRLPPNPSWTIPLPAPSQKSLPCPSATNLRNLRHSPSLHHPTPRTSLPSPRRPPLPRIHPSPQLPLSSSLFPCRLDRLQRLFRYPHGRLSPRWGHPSSNMARNPTQQ